MDRLTNLRAKLRARDGKAGYEKNCEMLRAEIAKLENAHLTTSQSEPKQSAVASKSSKGKSGHADT